MSIRAWKWGRYEILMRGAEGFEVESVGVPVYQSTGGPLFKTLLSSACRMDCKYCPFARYCRLPRVMWGDKLPRAFMAAYSMGLVGGLFLSSGLYGDPERVSADIVSVAAEIRRLGFKGYVALRLMPGTPSHIIRDALRVADRVGVNLETVDPSALAEIAPSKGSWSLDLLSPLLKAARLAGDPRRVSTQLIVGAAGETDEDHVRLAARLLEAGVGVIHYSPYTPIPGTPLASKLPRVPEWRAARLYEAVALLRDYGYRPEWIIDATDDEGMLPGGGSTLKEAIARAHPEWYPVDPTTATREELLRVPGIGPRIADRILAARRRRGRVTWADLRGILGSRMRAARPYIDIS